jgi:hypothetical protein
VGIKCQTFHTDFLTGLTEWTAYAGTTALPAQLAHIESETAAKKVSCLRIL